MATKQVAIIFIAIALFACCPNSERQRTTTELAPMQMDQIVGQPASIGVSLLACIQFLLCFSSSLKAAPGGHSHSHSHSQRHCRRRRRQHIVNRPLAPTLLIWLAFELVRCFCCCWRQFAICIVRSFRLQTFPFYQFHFTFSLFHFEHFSFATCAAERRK